LPNSTATTTLSSALRISGQYGESEPLHQCFREGLRDLAAFRDNLTPRLTQEMRTGWAESSAAPRNP